MTRRRIIRTLLLPATGGTAGAALALARAGRDPAHGLTGRGLAVILIGLAVGTVAAWLLWWRDTRG